MSRCPDILFDLLSVRPRTQVSSSILIQVNRTVNDLGIIGCMYFHGSVFCRTNAPLVIAQFHKRTTELYRNRQRNMPNMISQENHRCSPSPSPRRQFSRRCLIDLCLYRRVSQLCGRHIVLPLGVRQLIHDYVSESITEAIIRSAVQLWVSDSTLAELRFGHISDWEVGGVRSMARLFQDCTTFKMTSVGGM